MSELNMNWQTTLLLNTTPEASPTWSPFCDGWANLSESLNEVVHQTAYLCNKGWGSTEVTGGQFTLTLTGDRHTGDAVMDYIFGNAVKMNWGKARKTQMRLSSAGETFEWQVTLANITETRGDANQPNNVSVEIHANGPPQILEPTEILAPLTIVSVPGGSGKTKLYINPLLEGGNAYKYRTGAYVTLPEYGDSLATGWTAWNGTDDIAAIDGEFIAVAELAGGGAIKAGIVKVNAGS